MKPKNLCKGIAHVIDALQPDYLGSLPKQMIKI
jgi:hypothetical protein